MDFEECGKGYIYQNLSIICHIKQSVELQCLNVNPGLNLTSDSDLLRGFLSRISLSPNPKLSKTVHDRNLSRNLSFHLCWLINNLCHYCLSGLDLLKSLNCDQDPFPYYDFITSTIIIINMKHTHTVDSDVFECPEKM